MSLTPEPAGVAQGPFFHAGRLDAVAWRGRQDAAPGAPDTVERHDVVPLVDAVEATSRTRKRALGNAVRNSASNPRNTLSVPSDACALPARSTAVHRCCSDSRSKVTSASNGS